MSQIDEFRNKLLSNKPKMNSTELTRYFIHQTYSIDDEIAIIRQKDEKPEEWKAYYAHCEKCKQRAREYLKR